MAVAVAVAGGEDVPVATGLSPSVSDVETFASALRVAPTRTCLHIALLLTPLPESLEHQPQALNPDV